MTRREAIFLVSIFLGLLVLPGLSGLLGFAAGTTEKRRPAPWPQQLGAGFFARFDAALADRLGLRGEAIELDARLDLELFRDSPRPSRVWRGEDDWLFLTGFWNHPCSHQDAGSGEIVATLARVSRLVEASGRRFRLVVAPDKFAVESQRLAGRLHDLPDCGPAKRRAVEAALRAGEVAGAVDLWTPLRGLRGREELYYHGDIHWRPLGAMVMVRELVESLEPGLWRREHVVRGLASGRQAGTLAYLGIAAFEEAEGVTVRRPGTRLLELTEEQWHEGGWRPREPRLERHGERLRVATIERLGSPRIRWRANGPIDERVTMIHDSFAWDALPMLVEHLADARLLTWAQAVTELGGRDLAWAETVIVQSVEYELYSRLAQLHGVMLRGLDPEGGRPQALEEKPSRSGRLTWRARLPPGEHPRTLVFELETPAPALLRIAARRGREALPKRDIWLESGPPQLVAVDLEAGVDRLMTWSGRDGTHVSRAWLYDRPP